MRNKILQILEVVCIVNLIILGPQGSGKGTQAQMLQERRGFAHVSTGDLLRDEVRKETDLGKKAKSFMEKGLLVPDSLVVAILEKRLREPDCEKGFVLDGFPRTLQQAKLLEELLKRLNKKIDAVINLPLSREESLRRLAGRRTCEKCGAIFNVERDKLENDVCPKCGGKLFQRSDEKPETIKTRLEIYYKQTTPLIDYYAKKGLLHSFDGNGGAEKIFAKIEALLKTL